MKFQKQRRHSLYVTLPMYASIRVKSFGPCRRKEPSAGEQEVQSVTTVISLTSAFCRRPTFALRKSSRGLPSEPRTTVSAPNRAAKAAALTSDTV